MARNMDYFQIMFFMVLSNMLYSNQLERLKINIEGYWKSYRIFCGFISMKDMK